MKYLSSISSDNCDVTFVNGTFTGDLTVDTNTLYVDSTNNRVGIGTNNPSKPLHVIGTGRPALFDSSNGVSIVQIVNNTSGSGTYNGLSLTSNSLSSSIINSYGVPLAFGTSSTNGVDATERMRITSGGNVLIGTTTDSGYKLDVSGNSTSGVVRVKNAANGRDTLRSENAGGTRTFNIGNDGSGHGIVLVRNSSGTTTTYIAGSGNSYFNGGNIGIGTSSPAATLNVYNVAAAPKAIFQHGTTDHLSILIGTNGGGIAVEDNNDFSIFHQDYANRAGETGLTTRFRINSSGNVGIGTTSPAQKLHVSGRARVDNNGQAFDIVGTDHVYHAWYPRGTSGGRKAYMGYASGSTTSFTIMNEDTGDFNIGTNNAQRVRIAASGNLLIGTTTDSGYKLDVNGTTRLQNDVLISGGNNQLSFFSGSPTGYRLYRSSTTMILRSDGSITEDAASVYSIKTANTERMRITSTGAVGIGTSSPASLLTVEGAVGGDPMLRLKSTGTATSEDVYMAFNRDNVNNQGYTIGLDSGNNSFKISEDGDSITDSNRLTISSGGNVGIGTTSPSVKLEVSGAIHSSTYIKSNYQSGFAIGSISGVPRVQTDASANVRFLSSGDAESLRITDSGDVGIGTTSPDSIVHVEQAKQTLNTTNLDNGTAVGLHLTYPDTTLTGGEGIALAMGMNGRGRSYIANLSATVNKDASDMLFYTENGGVIGERMRINSYGSVGIGTTSPSDKLHVSGGNMFLDNGYGLRWGDNSVGIYGNASNETISMYTSSSERARITSGGNVLIGTTTDGGQKLQVNGSVLASDYIGSTHIYLSSPDSWIFRSTGGTERMRLTSAGSLGIGTTSPDQKLHVVGNAKVTGVFYTDYVQTLSGTSIDFRHQDASTIMRVDTANARVGIGTTSPARTLHVKKTGDNEVARFESDQTTSYIELEDANTTGQILIGTQGDNFKIHTAGSERLRINGSGNVGIGTTSPDSIVHAEQAKQTLSTTNLDNGTAVGLHLTYPDTALTGGEGIALAMGMNGRGRSYIANLSATANKDASDMLFYTENGGVIGERMRINSYGNVLIGTTTDDGSNKLQVAGSIKATGIIESTSGSTDHFRARYGVGGSYYTDYSTNRISFNGTGQNLDIIDNGNTRVRFASGGNVGIGTSSPSQKLDVAGAVNSTDYRSTNAIYITSDGDDTGTNPIIFRHSASEKMRITSGGNVLIGTTTDSGYKLNVAGDAIVSGANKLYLRDSLTYIWESSGLTLDSGHSTRPIKALIGGSEKFRVHTDGNVGVGTSSPAQKLHVSGRTRVDSNGQAFDIVGTDHVYHAWYPRGTSGGRKAYMGFASGSTTSFTIMNEDTGDFNIGTNNAQRVRIAASGNLLVGTTTDSGYKLDVNGDATINGVRVGRGAGNVDGNTVLGSGAFNSNSTGLQNTAIGYQSLRNNTGQYNTALGFQAGYNNTTGERNTAIGRHSLYSNSTGSYNTSLGMNSLTSSTASNNTALGYGTLFNATTATNNTAVGVNALTNTTSSNNTAVGYEAGLSNTTGSITAIGYQALKSNTTGGENVAIGRESMRLATASNNTAVGTYSGYVLTTGSGNTMVGRRALFTATTATYNTALGYQALHTSTASNNTAIGANAAYSNTTGTIVAVGYQAGYSQTTGSQNTAIGYQSLKNNLSSYNTAVGYYSLLNNSTGQQNTAVGRYALVNNTGSYNTAVGTDAAYSNTTGSIVSVGYQAGYGNTTGGGNTFIGHQSFQNNTTASSNTSLGYQAGRNIIGSNNTVLGAGAVLVGSGGSNLTVVGREALYNNTQSNNTAIGYKAARGNTTGSIVAVGYEAGLSNTTGAGITALGYSALKNSTGSDNTSVGYASLFNNTTGIRNTAVGKDALVTNSTGQDNVAIGESALRNNTSSFNTAIGREASLSNTSGNSNTSVGYQALKSNSTSSANAAFGMYSLLNNTGADNTAIGQNAGRYNTTGTNNIFVGKGADGVAATDSNRTFIGNSSTTSTWVGGNLLVGTTTDSGATVHIRQNSSGQSPINSPSLFIENNGSSNSYYALQVATQGGGYSFNVTNAGRVGIGTASPSYKLEIKGTSNNIGDGNQIFSVGNTSGGTQLAIGSSENSYTWIRSYESGVGGRDLSLVTNGEAIRIKSGGNVLIGTNTDSGYKLDVSGKIAMLSDGTLLWGSAFDFGKLTYDTGKAIVRGASGKALSLGANNTQDTIYINTSQNVGIGTASPSSKLHVVGDFFLKGSDTSSSTKNLQVQTGNGTSIMDFRNDAYAFFGCGQGGGSASGFIFRYNSTFGVQFTGYNYGNGTSPSYKPILMDTDLAGRSQGVYVNYGITGYTAPAPTSNTEFAVRGRGTSSQFTAKFEDSSTNPLLYIKDNGNVMIGTGTDSGYKLDVEGNTNTNGDYYVNGNQGWSGTININTNPPVAITVEGGIITNVT